MNSGNPIVTQTTHLLMIKAQDILRKVMLYLTHTDTEYIVIDYERTGFPLQPEDIVIPQHPEPGDMISVSGEHGLPVCIQVIQHRKLVECIFIYRWKMILCFIAKSIIN